MSKRLLALLTLHLGTVVMPLMAADNTFDSTLSPWGVQGQVALPADAALAQTQIATLADERDSLLWVRDRGGFPLVQPAPTEPVLQLGVVSPTVETLRVRLILSNDLPESYAAPAGSLAGQTFDFEVLQAVQRFQTRHGLASGGVVDADTRKALNLSVERRLEDLDLSLQTWKTLATEIGDGEAFLLVNTIEGSVRLFAAGSQQLELKASLHGTSNTDGLAGSTLNELSGDAQTGSPRWEPGEEQLQVENQEALVHAILYTASDWDLATIQTAVTSTTTSIPLLNPVNVHVVALANWVDQGVVRYLDADTAKTTKNPGRPLPPALIADADSAAAAGPSLPR